MCRAKIVGHDPFTDVAVVKVDPKTHALDPVPLGDSSNVVVGAPVAAIGSPFGNETSLTVGVVSATGRSIASLTSRYNVIDAIQIDAPINRGNSGGPLFDARGRVIGVNAQIRSESGVNEGVGFAIPINAARRSLDQLVEDGEVDYAYVGVTTSDLTPSLAKRFGFTVQRGAVVSRIEPNSPASRAGLKGGVAGGAVQRPDVPRRRRRDRRDQRRARPQRRRRRSLRHRGARARGHGRLRARPRRQAAPARDPARVALARVRRG